MLSESGNHLEVLHRHLQDQIFHRNIVKIIGISIKNAAELGGGMPVIPALVSG